MQHLEMRHPNRKDSRGSWVFIGVCLVLMMIFGLGIAFAEEKTFTFTPPTQCEDGTPIGSNTCGELLEYNLECAVGNGPPYPIKETFTSNGNTHTKELEPGAYTCVLSVRNVGGYSGWSNEVNFTIAIPQSLPNPPVLSVD